MKTIKVLTTALLLFLTASVNMVSAQNDSIYGLDVKVENDIMNLSFFSTYDKKNLDFVYINFYDTNNEELKIEAMLINHSEYYLEENLRDTFICVTSHINYFNILNLQKITENVFEIKFEGLLLNDSLKNKSLKIELYLEGEGYMPPSDSLRSATTVGQSNVLTFYFDPLNSSLKETTDSGNYTYKYYLLSGLESKTKPVEEPFIQATFKNGKLISTNKVIQVKK